MTVVLAVSGVAFVAKVWGCSGAKLNTIAGSLSKSADLTDNTEHLVKTGSTATAFLSDTRRS